MGTFSALLALCAGNSPGTGEFPAQRPVTRSFDVFFDLRLNKRLSKQWWGWWYAMPSSPLWHHCNVVFNTKTRTFLTIDPFIGINTQFITLNSISYNDGFPLPGGISFVSQKLPQGWFSRRWCWQARYQKTVFVSIPLDPSQISINYNVYLWKSGESHHAPVSWL